MTFEMANDFIADGSTKMERLAWEEFDLEFRGSICEMCKRRFECVARDIDNDDSESFISSCHFYDEED